MRVLPAPSSATTGPPDSPDSPQTLEISDRSPKCVRCSYDLRGAPAEGRCPECGLSIARSVELADLCKADHAWLMGMARGIAWLAIGLAASLIFIVLLILADASEAQALGENLSTIPLAGALVSFAIGFYLVTLKRDDQWTPRGFNAVRVVTRWIFAVALPLVPVAIWLPKLGSTLADDVAFPTMFLLAGGFASALLYALMLAEMINNRSLVLQTRVILCGLILCGMLISVLGMAIMHSITSFASPWIPRITYSGTLLFALRAVVGTVLLLGVWTLALLLNYGKCFREAAIIGLGVEDNLSASPPLPDSESTA